MQSLDSLTLAMFVGNVSALITGVSLVLVPPVLLATGYVCGKEQLGGLRDGKSGIKLSYDLMKKVDVRDLLKMSEQSFFEKYPFLNQYFL